MRLRSSRQAGFTILELIVVIIIISILGLFALDRIWSLRIEAEQATVTKIIGNVRSALGLEVSRLALKGRLTEIANLADSNPIDLLAQAPGSYLQQQPDNSDQVTPGSWYFDKESRSLIYHVIYSENLATTLSGTPRIRYYVKLIYNDRNNNNKFDLNIDSIGGLDLVPVEKFAWKRKLETATSNS